MKNRYKVLLIGIAVNVTILNAQPVITQMWNNSNFMYQLIANNGSFGCNKALNNNPFFLDAKSSSSEPILVGLQFPSIVLRPISYLGPQSKRYSFVDANNEFDKAKITLAFNVWKISNQTKYKDAMDWFENWVGGDIVIHHNYLEILGYVMNSSKVVIANKKHANTALVQWSQGVFARLSLGIKIQQIDNKGIVPFIESYVGEGALCKDGTVENV